MAPRHPKTAIINARVFDGEQITDQSTVVIEDGLITDNDQDIEQTIDANGQFLLPGLIDTHVHIERRGQLDLLAVAGVTTAFDMGGFSPELTKFLQSESSKPGRPSLFNAGLPATCSGTNHSSFPGWPKDQLVNSAEDAPNFVADRISEGSHYIKVISDVPPGGPTQEVLNAIVSVSHSHSKLTVAHASKTGAIEMCQTAGFDIITHTPLDAALSTEQTNLMAQDKRVSIPTLTMMHGIAAKGIPGIQYSNARDSVKAMHEAGVTILAGTDANAVPAVPFNPPHGTSIHSELELLVEAGMSCTEALKSATSKVATVFGDFLGHKGRIEVGWRADLVLVKGDPVERIGDIRLVEKVWCGGVEVDLSRELDEKSGEEMNKEPAQEEPGEEEPVKEEPVKEEPVKEEPVQEEPVKEEPIMEESVKDDPIKSEPIKEEPVKEPGKASGRSVSGSKVKNLMAIFEQKS